MKKIALLLCAWRVFAVSGAAWAATSDEQAKGSVAVAQLVGEFIYNPFKAEAERMGKTVNVKGRIALMGMDRDTEKPAVIFEHQDGSGQRWQVKFFVSKDDPMLLKVGRGETVTIQGTVSGFDDSVILVQECKIIGK